MAKYLISTTEIYRVNSEIEAQNLIQEAKSASQYVLHKYSSEYKEVKAKGEVVDTFYKVTLVKTFNDNIKEPERQVVITYEG